MNCCCDDETGTDVLPDSDGMGNGLVVAEEAVVDCCCCDEAGTDVFVDSEKLGTELLLVEEAVGVEILKLGKDMVAADEEDPPPTPKFGNELVMVVATDETTLAVVEGNAVVEDEEPTANAGRLAELEVGCEMEKIGAGEDVVLVADKLEKSGAEEVPNPNELGFAVVVVLETVAANAGAPVATLETAFPKPNEDCKAEDEDEEVEVPNEKLEELDDDERSVVEKVVDEELEFERGDENAEAEEADKGEFEIELELELEEERLVNNGAAEAEDEADEEDPNKAEAGKADDEEPKFQDVPNRGELEPEPEPESEAGLAAAAPNSKENALGAEDDDDADPEPKKEAGAEVMNEAELTLGFWDEKEKLEREEGCTPPRPEEEELGFDEAGAKEDEPNGGKPVDANGKEDDVVEEVDETNENGDGDDDEPEVFEEAKVDDD